MRPSCPKGAETERRKSRDVLRQRAGLRGEARKRRGDIARIVFIFRENGVYFGTASLCILGLRWYGFSTLVVGKDSRGDCGSL